MTYNWINSGKYTGLFHKVLECGLYTGRIIVWKIPWQCSQYRYDNTANGVRSLYVLLKQDLKCFHRDISSNVAIKWICHHIYVNLTVYLKNQVWEKAIETQIKRAINLTKTNSISKQNKKESKLSQIEEKRLWTILHILTDNLPLINMTKCNIQGIQNNSAEYLSKGVTYFYRNFTTQGPLMSNTLQRFRGTSLKQKNPKHGQLCPAI